MLQIRLCARMLVLRMSIADCHGLSPLLWVVGEACDEEDARLAAYSANGVLIDALVNDWREKAADRAGEHPRDWDYSRAFYAIRSAIVVARARGRHAATLLKRALRCFGHVAFHVSRVGAVPEQAKPLESRVASLVLLAVVVLNAALNLTLSFGARAFIAAAGESNVGTRAHLWESMTWQQHVHGCWLVAGKNARGSERRDRDLSAD